MHVVQACVANCGECAAVDDLAETKCQAKPFFYFWHRLLCLLTRYIGELHRSKFCLCLPSDTMWSLTFYEALVAGCVPVLFDDNQAWDILHPSSCGAANCGWF